MGGTASIVVTSQFRIVVDENIEFSNTVAGKYFGEKVFMAHLLLNHNRG